MSFSQINILDKNFKKIGFNLGIQSIGRIISVILSFVSVIVITRYLGVSGYGEFSLAFAYVSLFSVTADLGLQVVMVRDLSQKVNTHILYGNFFTLKLSLIAFSVIGCFLSLFFFPYSYEVKIAIIVAMLATAISGVSNYGTAILQSQLKQGQITLIDTLSRAFSLLFVFLFVYLDLGLIAIVGCVLLGNIVGLMYIFIKLKDKFILRFSKNRLKRIVNSGIPIGILTLSGVVYFKLDSIVLSILSTQTDLGLYNLSYRIIENLLILWGFYMATAFPIFANLASKKSFKQINNLIKNSIKTIIILSTIIILLTQLLAPFLIKIIGGNSFLESVSSLRILVLSIPFLFLNNLITDLCIAFHNMKTAIFGIILAVILNLSLNIIFVPKFGFIGAAYITLITAIFLSIYNVVIILMIQQPHNKPIVNKR